MSSGVARCRAAFGEWEVILLPPSGAERVIESTIRLDTRDVKRQIDVDQ
jgi:hypothetical protein